VQQIKWNLEKPSTKISTIAGLKDRSDLDACLLNRLSAKVLVTLQRQFRRISTITCHNTEDFGKPEVNRVLARLGHEKDFEKSEKASVEDLVAWAEDAGVLGKQCIN